MNTTIAFFLSALCALSLHAAEKPNIVIIMSDDQGWTDYGFMGHEHIKTPHLDKLAERSVLFKRGYVASPLCRPSLASVITGRFPFDHGVTGNDVDGYNNRAELDIPVREAFDKHPSFVKLLTADGYLTHQSGKWWEGSYKEGGFTHGMTHGDPKRGGRHGDAGLTIGREGMKPIADFLDHATGEKKPFLIWYAPFLPHTPHNPPPRLLEKYTQTGRAADVAKYYAMCEWFDETCGELLGHLESRGLSENTLVIYICDNGWVAPSENAADPNQKSWGQYALRSKSSPYEMGIRTPIMLTWPGRLKPADSPDFAHAIDLFPTIAATDATAGEFGPDQALAFTLSRSGSTTAPLSVQLSASGIATPGSDYTGFASPFEIPAGQASADLNLTVLADNLSEGPETVILTVLPAALYNPGTPASAQATIADRPDQAAYFAEIPDPALRGPADDGDGDGVPNAIERFMGTLVGNASSKDQLQILEPAPGSFKIRYPRALNRAELTGSLRWTTDLTTWRSSGESDGTLTITFDEAAISDPAADPEIIEATATITGGTASKAFIHLRVE
jgi:hypothetical protein